MINIKIVQLSTEKEHGKLASNFDFRNENKTEHAFKTFAQDVKRGFEESVLFMYGAEDYLIEWAVDTLVKRFVGKFALDTDFERPDGDTVTAEEILRSCETFSMLSERRLIWVRDYAPLLQDNAKGFSENQLKQLEEYLDMPNQGTLLIFSSSRIKNDPKDRREKRTKLDKLLLKKARCYDFCPLDRKALRAFIEKRIKSSGLVISRDNVEYLMDSTGYFHKDTEYRLMNLDADLTKIVSLASDRNGMPDQGESIIPDPEEAEAPRPEISRDDIDRAILGDMDTYIFGFLDNLAANRKEEAFITLNNMMAEGSDVFGLLSMMVNQFELMTEVKELGDEGMSNAAISKELGIHEFRVKKAVASANRLNLDKLKNILCQLYEIDTNIKQGNIDGTLALELLIGRI